MLRLFLLAAFVAFLSRHVSIRSCDCCSALKNNKSALLGKPGQGFHNIHCILHYRLDPISMQSICAFMAHLTWSIDISHSQACSAPWWKLYKLCHEHTHTHYKTTTLPSKIHTIITTTAQPSRKHAFSVIFSIMCSLQMGCNLPPNHHLFYHQDSWIFLTKTMTLPQRHMTWVA